MYSSYAATIIYKLQELCHAENRHFWIDVYTGESLKSRPHIVGEKLMLIVSELSEAMEGHRKGIQDSHLPQFKSIEVELADALIRIFDLAGAFDLDLNEAFAEKLLYNRTRLDHTLETRRAPGGKAY